MDFFSLRELTQEGKRTTQTESAKGLKSGASKLQSSGHKGYLCLLCTVHFVNKCVWHE